MRKLTDRGELVCRMRGRSNRQKGFYDICVDITDSLLLADIIGVNRQVMVIAFQFGDGFSNLFYPTNPVLLISLGLTVVSYTKWFKWVFKLQAALFVMTLIQQFTT